ncbi:tripartite tricarboxylate transporter substrate binding protein [Aquabacterium sp. OR-4]|uniref:tripartite tricarboxylate transporter substrate binding protein n=1 Tax=Aquabacterium sp. OR-4 TaxID=2978127 RepID=UPI0021B28B16|nr:tripartite tricarboxylate transporter substrate binding protein [Aquabacterium sp. OR-4]MDT7838538.1 tripartite tricarboxylate transporter substrate binding protein [Aquabacterium sp. OR-4]
MAAAAWAGTVTAQAATAATAGGAGGAGGASLARTPWPQRPLRLRSAYPPGGVSDEVLRALAARLNAQLGVPVLVEHLPGAGGTLAMEWLARAGPEGHELVFSATSPLSVSPHLGRLRYDPLRDIQPLCAVMTVPLLVVGTPALASASLAAALAEAQRLGQPLRWASSGLATTGHLALEAVRLASGAPIVHVPYKGGGQQISDALGGQFELLSSNVAPAQLALVRQGRLKALAVGADAPLASLPGVPTLAQAGFAEANLASTFGLFAPGSTPAALLDAMHQALRSATADEAWRARLLSADNQPLAWSRAEFSARVHDEWQRRGALVRRLGPALAEARSG